MTIACSHDLAQIWLMPRFRELAERIHDRQVRVITATTYESFDAPDIDLSIRFGDGKWPGFTAAHLFDEEGFPICAPELLARHPELLNAPPQVLMKFPLLRLASEETIGLKWADWLRHQGVKLPVVTGPIFSTSPFCFWNWWRRVVLRWGTSASSTNCSSIGASSGFRPIGPNGFGLLSRYREPEPIPIDALIHVFRKGLDAQQGIGQSITTDA